MPSPPALVTAAASLPPAADPIGASRIGCSMASIRVSAVSMMGMRDPHGLANHGARLVARSSLPFSSDACRFALRIGTLGSRCKLLAQRAQLFEPCGAVAHDRSDSAHPPGVVGKW